MLSIGGIISHQNCRQVRQPLIQYAKMKAGSASALVILVTVVFVGSSSSVASTVQHGNGNESGRPPVTCVAFQPDEDAGSSILSMGQCLTPGNAICSSGGSWAFGIDPTDQRIKLWEADRVLFASSEWTNAGAICIGGNANQYGPHEYAWYEDGIPYLFVSYDSGNSKAFLQCKSLLSATAAEQAHFEIDDITPANVRMTNAPIISFQEGASVPLWSIDAWGSVRTSTDCEWYTDAVGFTAEIAVGEDFGQLALTSVKDESEKDDVVDSDLVDETTRKYMLRPTLRTRWGGNGGDLKARTKWGANVLQPRMGGTTTTGTATTTTTTSSSSDDMLPPGQCPSGGKGKGKGGSSSAGGGGDDCNCIKCCLAEIFPTESPSASPSSSASPTGKAGKGKGGKNGGSRTVTMTFSSKRGSKGSKGSEGSREPFCLERDCPDCQSLCDLCDNLLDSPSAAPNTSSEPTGKAGKGKGGNGKGGPRTSSGRGKGGSRKSSKGGGGGGVPSDILEEFCSNICVPSSAPSASPSTISSEPSPSPSASQIPSRDPTCFICGGGNEVTNPFGRINITLPDNTTFSVSCAALNLAGKLDLLGPDICDALGTIQNEINSACECMPDITMSPTSSRMPSNTPSLTPSGAPSSAPSASPSVEPSLSANPTVPSATSSPTPAPSKSPSQIPSQSAHPTAVPTAVLSNMPSQTPTVTPGTGNEPCDICPDGDVLCPDCFLTSAITCNVLDILGQLGGTKESACDAIRNSSYIEDVCCNLPSDQPSSDPSSGPSIAASSEPSVTASQEPSRPTGGGGTDSPSNRPSSQPSPKASASPSDIPSAAPTFNFAPIADALVCGQFNADNSADCNATPERPDETIRFPGNLGEDGTGVSGLCTRGNPSCESGTCQLECLIICDCTLKALSECNNNWCSSGGGGCQNNNCDDPFQFCNGCNCDGACEDSTAAARSNGSPNIQCNVLDPDACSTGEACCCGQSEPIGMKTLRCRPTNECGRCTDRPTAKTPKTAKSSKSPKASKSAVPPTISPAPTRSKGAKSTKGAWLGYGQGMGQKMTVRARGGGGPSF